MTDQYTPTTEEVRRGYSKLIARQRGSYSSICDEFDRWLAAHDAAIEAAAEQRGAEEGWDLAIDYAWDDSSIYEADAKRAKAANPYRADQEGDDE